VLCRACRCGGLCWNRFFCV
jgi:hypothetical protein